MAHSPSGSALDLVDRTLKIGTVPETLAEIQSLVRSDNVALQRVVEAIDRDPAIAAATLRLANSPFYGLKTKASSVRMACVVLGFRAIERLVVQAAVLQRFGEGDAAAGLPLSQLWEHSFRRALIARLLAICCVRTRHLAAEDVYTCGLLHDVGKAAMLQGCPRDFARALTTSREKRQPLRQAQREAFGYSDDEVLVLLAKRWNLGSQLVASASPRRPEPGGHDGWLWSALVHAAERIAHDSASGGPLWEPDPFAAEAVELLGADASLVAWIVERVEQVAADG